MLHDAFERRFSTNHFWRHWRRGRCAAQIWNSERLARRARHATKDFGPALTVDAGKKEYFINLKSFRLFMIMKIQ
jgi:hypothetical protein